MINKNKVDKEQAIIHFGINGNVLGFTNLYHDKISPNKLINVSSVNLINYKTGLPVKTYPLITMDEFLYQRELFLIDEKYGVLSWQWEG